MAPGALLNYNEPHPLPQPDGAERWLLSFQFISSQQAQKMLGTPRLTALQTAVEALAAPKNGSGLFHGSEPPLEPKYCTWCSTIHRVIAVVMRMRTGRYSATLHKSCISSGSFSMS